MISAIRYQIFLSSTYEDLREERQQATQAVLEAGFFPAGMELFPASDDTQWELIKRVIEESDYYVVIVGGRYGSTGPEGISYTEMEYDYAVANGVPVLGFVRNSIGDIPFAKTEPSDIARKKLDAFRKKVMSRTCRRYSSPAELGMAVMKSLMAEARIRPRTGWIRADQARSEADVERERQLVIDLKEANDSIETLEREVRDRTVLVNEVPRAALAQGEDFHELTVTFSDRAKNLITCNVKVTWNEIFRVIGSSIYGYIVRKTDRHGELPKYPFQDNVEAHVRAKIIDEVQNRKLTLEPSQIDSCILQFKELGLVRFAETKKKAGEIFRGVTLTEAGERHLTRLSVQHRQPELEPA